MFSLITTIVSIVLVGLLAVATLYYMGDTVNDRGSEASAATLVAQGEQILGAMEIRKTDGLGPLGTIGDLTAAGSNGQTYLSSVPSPPSGAYPSTIAATPSDWTLLNPQNPTTSFMLQTKVSRSVCHQLNRKVGESGDIFESADPARRIQCFGTSEPFTVLFGSGATFLQDVTTFNVGAPAPVPLQTDGGAVAFVDPSGSTPVVTPPSVSFTPVLSAAADPRSIISATAATLFSPATLSATSDATATLLSVLGGGSPEIYCKTEGGEETCDLLEKPIVSYIPFNYNVMTIANTTTNAVIVLGQVPNILEPTPFGGFAPIYAEMATLAGRTGAFTELTELQAFANSAGVGLYDSFRSDYNLSFPTYNLPPLVNTSVPVSQADVANICASGQTLSPGQSCQLFTDDVAPFDTFLVATDAGVEIPFMFGPTAATANIPGKFVVIR